MPTPPPLATAGPRSGRAGALVAALLAGSLAPLGSGPAHATSPSASTSTSTAARASARQIAYTSWDTDAELVTGRLAGTRVSAGEVRLDAPRATQRWAGARYDAGRWTSPWTTPGFGFSELVASWEATTPPGTFVRVQARGRSAGGTTGSWDDLGRWASYDTGFRRASAGAQTDDLGSVATDTWHATTPLSSWQVRVTLLRRSGTTATPRLDAAGAMVSALPATADVATSRPGVARGVTLPVPRYSQMVHEGHFPEYDDGGEAWCSPTSLAMVLAYYDALPPAEDYAWVGAGHTDPVVDHTARQTYDYVFRGAGNWAFNTAYAATRVEQAFVTRLPSLRSVERFVKAGIPVVVSVAFRGGELAGSPLTRGTDGHLLVVVGFTAGGDVVVNDPAAARKPGVRRTYDRGQLEDVWLRRGTSAGGSGGIAYVVRDAAHPLPERNGATSW